MTENERIETLVCVLKGYEMDEIAEKLFLTTKGVKYRLTQVYKFYKVKNRFQLMSMFVTYPVDWDLVRSNVKVKKVKPTKKVIILGKNDSFLPIGLKF